MNKIEQKIIFEDYYENTLKKLIRSLNIFHFKNGSWNQRYAEAPDSFITVLKFSYFNDLFDFLKINLKIAIDVGPLITNIKDKIEFINSQLRNRNECLRIEIVNYSNLKLEFPIVSTNEKLSKQFIENVKSFESVLSQWNVIVNFEQIYTNPNIINRYIYPELYKKDAV